MGDENKAVVSGDVSPEERQKRIEAALFAKLDTIAQAHEDRMLDGLTDILAKYEVPDPGRAPEIVNRKGETVHRLSSPTEPMYRRMPEDLRAVRNPDSDHWMAEWLRGLYAKNHSQLIQASGKLESMFGRAETLEGAADASGGFAGGTGGVLLPRPLEAVVMVERDRVAKMQRWATEYTMTAQEHNIPTAGAMVAYMVNEGSPGLIEASTGEPTLGQVPLIARKAMVRAQASVEILEDAAVNLVSVFTQRAGARLGALEDEQFFRDGSTGVEAPNVVRLTPNLFSETTAGNLIYADLLAMYSNVQQEYRDNSRWLMASNVLQALAGVLSVSDGRPFYASLLDPPTPITDDASAVGTLLGRPVHEVVMTSGDAFFGDVRACYAIGRRRGITVAASEHFLFSSQRVVWLISERFAGNNIDTSAGQLVSGITTASIT